MPKSYKHLNAEERDLLAVWKGEGQSLRAIARRLGRDPATLSRELKRNAPPIRKRRYLPHKAQARYALRNSTRAMRPKLKSGRIRRYVGQRLAAGWSPELIAGRIGRLWPKETVSHEAIYGWIYSEARHHIPDLVRAHRRRLRRGYSRKHTKSHIPGRVSIEKRLPIVERRRQVGHWEADTAISRQSKAAIQAVVERTTRFAKLGKLASKSARCMRVGLNRTLSRYPESMRRTITYDNGTENTDHLITNFVLGTRSYFCNPFHSYERGTVENTIGLMRRKWPKKTDFAKLSRRQVKVVERWMNNRPRKCLSYKTPAEAFQASVALTG